MNVTLKNQALPALRFACRGASGNGGARARRRMAQMLGLGPTGLKDGAAPAMCPDPVQQADNSPMKKEQSCLRIREHPEDLRSMGSTATAPLEILGESASSTSWRRRRHCEWRNVFSRFPEHTARGRATQDGVSTCCVLSETQDDHVMQVEPGGSQCQDVTKFGLDAAKDCVFRNTCSYSIMLFPKRHGTCGATLKSRPLQGGHRSRVDATLCTAKTMRSAQQD